MIKDKDDSCHNGDLCLCLCFVISDNSGFVGASSHSFNSLKNAYGIVQKDSYIIGP